MGFGFGFGFSGDEDLVIVPRNILVFACSVAC